MYDGPTVIERSRCRSGILSLAPQDCVRGRNEWSAAGSFPHYYIPAANYRQRQNFIGDSSLFVLQHLLPLAPTFTFEYTNCTARFTNSGNWALLKLKHVHSHERITAAVRSDSSHRRKTSTGWLGRSQVWGHICGKICGEYSGYC
jgi:hypothetical protein